MILYFPLVQFSSCVLIFKFLNKIDIHKYKCLARLVKEATSENVRPMNLNTAYDRKQIQTPTKRPIQSIPQTTTPIQNQSNKGMERGKHVWTFLHTLIEKVKDDQFPHLCSDILKFIYKICTNLPCPLCSQHRTFHGPLPTIIIFHKFFIHLLLSLSIIIFLFLDFKLLALISNINHQ